MPTAREELLLQIEAQRGEYLKGVPEKLAAMRAHWEAARAGGDPAALASLERVAHSLHGTAGTFGLAAISRAAAAIEAAVEALGGAPEATPALNEAIDEALAALDRLLAGAPP